MTEVSLSNDIDIAIKTEAATKIYEKSILVTAQAMNQANKELADDLSDEQKEKIGFTAVPVEQSNNALYFID